MIEVDEASALRALLVAARMHGGCVYRIVDYGSLPMPCMVPAGYSILTTNVNASDFFRDDIPHLCWRAGDGMFGFMRMRDMGRRCLPSGRVDRGLGAVKISA